jgi:hypothetical protein
MLRLSVFTAGMAGVLYFLDTYINTTIIHPDIWVMLTFFFVLTLAGHFFVEWGLRRNKEKLMGYYMGFMGIRLLTSIGFLGFFWSKHTNDIFVFIGNFFVLYLLYVAFEIYWLMANLRQNSL